MWIVFIASYRSPEFSMEFPPEPQLLNPIQANGLEPKSKALDQEKLNEVLALSRFSAQEDPSVPSTDVSLPVPSPAGQWGIWFKNNYLGQKQEPDSSEVICFT